MSRLPQTLALLTAVALLAGAAQESDTAPQPPASGENAAQALQNSPRHGEWVDIRDDDHDDDDPTIRTWVVYPERPDNAPVVVVIHEIYGLTDWVRAVADQLAAEGFIAVAPDLLSGMGPDGGGTDSFPEGQVRDAIRQLSPDRVEDRLDDVIDWAEDLPSSTDEVGVIGFCWGGSAAFQYAIDAEDDIDAAVVYYGTAPRNTDDFDEIEAPVLGLYGGDDNRVTSTVEATEIAMAKEQKRFETHVYPGAGHGFLRQQEGRDNANATAARQAWERTIAFLRQHLEDN